MPTMGSSWTVCAIKSCLLRSACIFFDVKLICMTSTTCRSRSILWQRLTAAKFPVLYVCTFRLPCVSPPARASHVHADALFRHISDSSSHGRANKGCHHIERKTKIIQVKRNLNGLCLNVICNCHINKNSFQDVVPVTRQQVHSTTQLHFTTQHQLHELTL